MKSGAFAPDFVAYKLFRAVHSHNSNQSYTLHYDTLTLRISDLRAVQGQRIIICHPPFLIRIKIVVCSAPFICIIYLFYCISFTDIV